jgi:SAM-dependent methyltransferase
VSERRCPICATILGAEPVQSHRHWTLYQCQYCGVQAWHPMNNPGAEWYTGHYGYPWMEWLPPAEVYWQHQQYLQDSPAPGGRLLDVGCGTGAFLAAARDAGYEVTGIDFAEDVVQFARSRFGLDSVHASSLESFAAEQRPGSFDVITSFEVLEHQDDPTAFMASIRRLLRPQGFVALSVPNREGWPPASHESWDLPPHHFTRWNAHALRRACDHWSLAEISIRASSPCLVDLAAWIREISRINDLGRALLGQLERYDSAHRGRGPAVQAGHSVMAVSRISDGLLLPLTLPLKALLSILSRDGRSLYLLARRD